jgi:hypothetical protein
VRQLTFLLSRQPAMIRTNSALDRSHRPLCSCSDALALCQCNCASHVGISHGLDFLGDHPGALATASFSASRYFEETQGDNALNFETKSHRVQPRLPEEHASIPWRSSAVVQIVSSIDLAQLFNKFPTR